MDSRYHCQICEKDCRNEYNYFSHLNSKEHYLKSMENTPVPVENTRVPDVQAPEVVCAPTQLLCPTCSTEMVPEPVFPERLQTPGEKPVGYWGWKCPKGHRVLYASQSYLETPDPRYIVITNARYTTHKGLPSISLKPCPFCGREHFHSWKKGGYPDWRRSHCAENHDTLNGYPLPGIPGNMWSYYISKVEGEPDENGRGNQEI